MPRSREIHLTATQDAQQAINLFHAYNLGERPLTVNMAKPREERSSRGGSGYRGF